MRTLYLLLFLSIITTNAVAANITQVTFTSPTPTVTNTQIANLGGIKSIYTAGVYAWAIDSVNLANAAFYDGKQWQAGVSLPGVTAINGIYPAYPVTGKTSEAWADVTTNNGPGIAYFDGTNWYAPELIADILELPQSSIIQSSIVTSGGAVFVLAMSSPDYNTTYYSIKASASSPWNKPHSVAGEHLSVSSIYDVFDDNNPVLSFVTNERVSNINYLYRLALTGANAGIAEVESGAFPNVVLNTMPMVTADGSRLFVVYDSNPPQAEGHRMFSFKDFSTQNNWQLVPNFKSSMRTSSYNGSAADIENNGFICEAIELGMTINQTYACLDTTQAGNYWIPFPAITTDSNDWQLLTRADGAWVSFNEVLDDDNIETLIYSYDKKTESVINTRFPSKAFDQTQDTQVTQVGTSGLLACHGLIVIQPNPRPIKLYYYDNQNNLGWQQIKVGNTALTSCGFSVAGTPSHNLHRVSSGGTLWLFDNAPNPGEKQRQP